MRIDLLLKKIEAEKDVAPSFGPYRAYSFAMMLTNSPKLSRTLALQFFPKTLVTRAQAAYKYNQNKA